MQNAIIKYKIRISKGKRKNSEVEIAMTLSEFETDWSIKEQLFYDHQIDLSGWDSEAYTVIERTIEPFNED